MCELQVFAIKHQRGGSVNEIMLDFKYEIHQTPCEIYHIIIIIQWNYKYRMRNVNK